MTDDVPGALAFYKAVVGWTAQAFAGNNIGYHLLMVGKAGVGGVMPLPNAQQPPAWIGYTKVDDVDAAARDAVAAGGKILNDPMDIPVSYRELYFLRLKASRRDVSAY